MIDSKINNNTSDNGHDHPGLAGIFGRGAMRRCPACGEGKAFAGYLKVVHRCATCGTQLDQYKSDDLPPYLTIFIVGHLVVSMMMYFVAFTSPEQVPANVAIVWPAIAAVMVLVLLPVIKGMVLALQWHLHSKGALHEDSIRS